MIELGSRRPRRAAVDRRADRLVAMTAISIALAFLLLAVLVPFVGAGAPGGMWLPIHLALAGAATTAIAGVMPFFSAAIATSQPVDARVRWASLTAVAAGAAAITLGYTVTGLPLATVGGVLFSIGVALVGYATLVPLRRGLGPNGGVVAIGYAAAVIMVLAGAVLATLFLVGWPPVVEAWGYLKPAHAWLNLVGFVSLVIATTLLHFFPTVIGARIQRIWSAYTTTLGLASGAALVALGFTARSDVAARAGAVLVAVGAASLLVYATRTWRTRAAWSGDHGWHRFAMGGLVSAIAWFTVGIAIAASALMVVGAQPDAVRVDRVVGPFVAGWMGQAVLASATHLVPAIGPGDPYEHARQRVLLGRAATPRLVGANIGVAALTVGLAFDADGLTISGLLLIAAALGLTAALLVGAVISGIRNARSARP